MTIEQMLGSMQKTAAKNSSRAPKSQTNKSKTKKRS